MTFAAMAVFAAACSDPDERYDVGYDDGYTVGYNTTCRIRATMIEGDFDNAHYSTGYREGLTAGAQYCRSGGR